MKRLTKAKRFVYLLAGVCVLTVVMSVYSAGEYLSPCDVAADEQRGTLFVALTSAQSVAVMNMATGTSMGRIALKQNPNCLLLSEDRATLFVATGSDKGSVEVFSLPDRKRRGIIEVGHSPSALALSADGNILYAANRFANAVSVINIEKRKVTETIPAVREPKSLYVSPDGHTLAIANFLPAQASTDEHVAARLTLVELPSNKVRTHLLLPDGAQSVAGIAASTDGKWIYLTHLLSRYGMPVTQIDRGWVNTNALSIIDTENDELYATILLDDTDRGAANPHGIAVDGDNLFIALSGTHELMRIDMRGMHGQLATLFAGKSADMRAKERDDLSRSLSFAAPFKKRISLKGRSPRKLITANGKVYITAFFSTFVDVVNINDNSMEMIALGDEPQPDAVRRGEQAFYDASICYQQWQSCVSCHPDGRADGLNWDQQNDGLGNPKNTKSLLYSHVTPPSMITGIRATAEEAVRKGILHTLQTQQPESLAADMDAYLKSLVPVVSPYRHKDSYKRGRELYTQAGCNQCHSGEYLTDMAKYDVGTGEGDDAGRPFDTPSLREVWRTAPYLYDGRAKTLRDVFTLYNPDDRHGRTSNMTDAELEALILYLNTL